MTAPDSVLRLVDRFTQHADEYRAAHYNETQVRQEFIDPFFSALGWDVTNQSGRPADQKDVILEDAIQVGAATKAPDYGFYLGGQRRFFVEAKRPSVTLKSDSKPTFPPAFQLRRYAWNARLPLSILTTFAELAVYDGRVMPDPKDRAPVARIAYYEYTQYADCWEQIAALFGRQAVQDGALDRYAEAKTALKHVIPVDDAFLNEIERWRALLAVDIAKMNDGLTPRALNYAVQMTIDRIVFLRICEDRGIELPGRLLATQNGGNVYARLMHLFREADARYNSGLFHFGVERARAEAPDEFTPTLYIDDEPLREIILRLCRDSIYDFSQIPVEVLGHVYERFLGKIVQFSDSRKVDVIEKPEVRKAGGVYYTPTYIVDYIVRHTVGALLAGKTPTQAAKLRILDPACGSGSFLLGAYQFLLTWYRDWYVQDGADKHTDAVYEGAGGVWKLTTAERKRILLNNVYGVDIDAQAVEVTKLSLLLCVLEGESEKSITRQLELFKQRALPDLTENIKCGNSLIGFDAPAGTTDNPFDWKTEFPAIFKAGGFDAVIGNPPYVRIQTLRESAPGDVTYYKSAYAAAAKGNYDIYVVFVEQGLRLLSAKGRLGFILPHKFFNAQYGQPIRELLARDKTLSHVVHFGDQQIFHGATTYTALLFLDKAGSPHFRFVKVDDLTAWRATGQAAEGMILADHVSGTEWNFTVGHNADLFERLSKMPVKLRDIANFFVGLQSSADDVFLFKDFKDTDSTTLEVYSQRLKQWFKIETKILKPIIRSGQIDRYIAKPTVYMLFPYEIVDLTARLYTSIEMESLYPLAWEYLQSNRSYLESREHNSFFDERWYRFGRSQNLGVWEQSKLMIPYMITNLACYFDKSDNYYFVNVTTGGYGITVNDERVNDFYLCALLNSRLLDFYLKQVSTNFRSGYFAANKQYIEQLPIRPINFDDRREKTQHDQIVTLVERMLHLHQQRAATLAPPDQVALDRQIEATDRQIDTLVYALYGLTEDEIALIEG